MGSLKEQSWEPGDLVSSLIVVANQWLWMLNQLGSPFPQSKQSFTSTLLKSLSNSVILCAARHTIWKRSDLEHPPWCYTHDFAQRVGQGLAEWRSAGRWSGPGKLQSCFSDLGGGVWTAELGGDCSSEYLHAGSSAWPPRGSGSCFVATQGAESSDPAGKGEAAWPLRGFAFGVTSTISLLFYWRKQSRACPDSRGGDMSPHHLWEALPRINGHSLKLLSSH